MEEINGIPNEFVFTASHKISDKFGDYYQHFGIMQGFLSIYGVKPEDLRKVRLKVDWDVNLDNRQETNDVDYWGYWNYENKRLSMIYPSFIQFSVCFPYGPKNEENTGRGKCLNLKVVDAITIVDPLSHE